MQSESTPNTESPLEVALKLHQAGELSKARSTYLRLLQEKPVDFDIHYLLGLLEAQDKQLLCSAQMLSRALSILPDHQLAHWHMGEAFIQLGFYAAAIECFRRARHQDPTFLEAYVREGNLLKDAGCASEALVAYQMALSLDPLHSDVHFSLGNIFKGQFRHEEAIRHYKKSIISSPDRLDPYINLGNTLKDLNQLKSALASHRHAADIQPNNPVPQFNQSLIRLLMGDFVKGWEQFETRWDVVLSDQKRHFRKPRWSRSENISGKTLFVYAEQGLGDTLQFCRYLPILSSMGARVIFESPPELRSILQSLKGAITLITPGFPIPDFDYHIPLLGIPGILGTSLESIPRDVPYLRAEQENNARWKSLLKVSGAPRIGLTWSGGSVFRNDINRSLPLTALAPILDLNFDFHVIQKEIRESDKEAFLGQSDLTFHGHNLTDFSDTASLMDSMDLILTVDTSVAHLAGALNKPVWILLPFAPDFRWLLGRCDSPWYPSARLFRQDETMAWSKVVGDVREALLAYSLQR